MSQLGSIELPNISLYGLTPYGKANYTVIVIPEGVTTIGYWAFYDCIGLTRNNASVPDTCTIHWNSTGPKSV